MTSISNFGKIPKTVSQQVTTKSQGGVYGVYGNAAKKTEGSTELKKKSTVVYQPQNKTNNSQKTACTSNPYNDPYSSGPYGGGDIYGGEGVYGGGSMEEQWSEAVKKALAEELVTWRNESGAPTADSTAHTEIHFFKVELNGSERIYRVSCLYLPQETDDGKSYWKINPGAPVKFSGN